MHGVDTGRRGGAWRRDGAQSIGRGGYRGGRCRDGAQGGYRMNAGGKQSFSTQGEGRWVRSSRLGTIWVPSSPCT